MSEKNTGNDKQPNPKVGIFYFIDNELLVDDITLDEAEPYGEVLQHGGHYELWEALMPKTRAENKFKVRAYDAYPRGRVVYFYATKKFCIYADRCLTKNEILIVKARFRLESFDAATERDEHYKCARCNPYYMD